MKTFIQALALSAGMALLASGCQSVMPNRDASLGATLTVVGAAVGGAFGAGGGQLIATGIGAMIGAGAADREVNGTGMHQHAGTH